MSIASQTETDAAFLAEVERIRREFPATSPLGQTSSVFLDRVVGIFKDDPLFEDAVRAGQEWRNVDRPQDETPDDSSL